MPIKAAIRFSGILFLTLALMRIPLPQADFHNVRHHHGQGEICIYHDHLLRWHPTASQNDDVALLHWHWVLPQTDPGGQSSNDGDDSHNPNRGPFAHACLTDALEPSWDTLPALREESLHRVEPPASSRPLLNEGLLLSCLSLPPPFSAATARHSIDLSALHASLIALCQRSNC